MIINLWFLAAFLGSFLITLLIVSTERFHGVLTMDDKPGVQKLHQEPVPRVGGVALVFGAILGGVALPSEPQWLWFLICLSALPAFSFGLIEDITSRVGIKARLLATIGSGLIFSSLTGYQITKVDVPGIDYMLSLWPLSLLFTAFAIGGISNAINIIDGVNGLALGTSIIILSGFAVVAVRSGDMEIVSICIVAIGAIGGVFVFNFPKGSIFLGDAGAYSIGIILAAIAVTLPQRNPEISPLIGLLALSYPVIETATSVVRRVTRAGSHPGQPDRLHLHSLIYRSRARRLADVLGVPNLRNALAGLLLMALPLISVMLMVMFYNDSGLIALSVALVALIYIAVYRRVALLPNLTRFQRRANSAVSTKE